MADVFSSDEFDLHGFHDDRHVLVVSLASRIAAGIVANPQLIQTADALSPARRQVIADAALDIALKICSRVETKKSPTPSGKDKSNDPQGDTRADVSAIRR